MTVPAIADRPVRVLELRSVRGTGGGPEKTILQGAAATDPTRALVTVCYLRDARDTVFEMDRRAAAAGVDYVEVIERHSFDVSVVGAITRIIHARQIDVVHSHEYKTDAVAWLAARRTGVRLLSTAHGWTGHTFRERYLYYPANKRMLARFPLVLAVSSEIRQQLLEHGARPDRVRVLLNGIDALMFRRDPARRAAARSGLGVELGATVVGSVGRLEPQKRFDLLMDTCAALRKTVPALSLVIAGDGSERTALERHIAARGDAQWCRLLGHVNDVVELHHVLDLFVQSSIYEGTPNVVLEAMALETPIVATDVGGTSEICRPDVDGLIVPPRDADALAEAITRTLADPAGCASRVRSARARVETELSFLARVRVLEAIYQELVTCAPQ